MTITPFRLDPGSPAAMQPGKFGLKNVRTHSSFEKSLPHDVALRLQLPWLEFDVEGQQADWSPVVEACTQWHDLHRRLNQQPGFCGIKKSFFYFDGGDFLELVDIRDRVKTLILESPWREVYLYCMEIHSRKEVVARFDMSEDDLVNEVLEPLVDRRLMFKEKDKYLSLAVASTPAQAMRRIHSRENASGNLAASDRS